MNYDALGLDEHKVRRPPFDRYPDDPVWRLLCLKRHTHFTLAYFIVMHKYQTVPISQCIHERHVELDTHASALSFFVYLYRCENFEMSPNGLSATVLFLVLLALSGRAEEKKKWTIRSFLKNCSPSSLNKSDDSQDFVDILRRCMQRRALVVMDAMLGDDVIPVFEGIDLVRYKKHSSNLTNGERTNGKAPMEGREVGKSWMATVFGRLARTFRTHVLKIDVDKLSRITGGSNATDPAMDTGSHVFEGRRRHHRRRQMMPMLMMGIMIMGSVLIPMGFQFLAVLGGKALILAKLALMLSSIQGLKKIATNGVNYGLYHSPEPWHERSAQEANDGRYEMPYPYYYPMPPPV